MLVVAIGLFSRGRTTAPGILVAVVAIAVGGWVNPFYDGVLDLRQTAIGQEIESVNAAAPGAWVSVSGFGSAAVLRETGVEAYSGDQAWPSKEMWDAIDPDHSDASVWNRYAHINWTTDPSIPEIGLVAADIVQLRFDSCNAFAQGSVRYVLSDKPVAQQCLATVATVPEPAATYYVYRVVGHS